MAESKPKTRHDTQSKISEYVGTGKEFCGSEVPSYRAVVRRAILLQELKVIELNVERKNYPVKEMAKDLAPLVIAQWTKSNVKFSPPVIISERSVSRKIESFWDKVSEVVRGRAKKPIKDIVEKNMDRLFDLTICPHTIYMCSDQNSGCYNKKDCKIKTHISCDCPLSAKVPKLELE